MQRLKLWLESVDFRGAGSTAFGWLGTFLAYLWASVKDCFSRKTTWAAIGLVGVLFWCGGYMVGADKKREAYNAMNAAIERMAEAKAAESRLVAELFAAKTRVQSLSEELEEARKAKPDTAPGPPAAKSKPKPKPVAVAPAPAPVAAPATSWNPFSR